MIEIHPLKDSSKLRDLYDRSNVTFETASSAVVASDADEVLGYCLFYTEKDSITVTAVEPQDDVLLADGILRAALHVGVENGIETAFYSENAPIQLFDKLKFIKNAEKRELDVEKLFSSCQNCRNT